MTTISINDPEALAAALARREPVVDVEIHRGSLRTALSAVVPHSTDEVPRLDRVRLQFVDGERMVACAMSGYTAAIACVRVEVVESLPELGVLDIESRSAREVLAVLAPPRDKDARAAWLAEAFHVTATADEVTFAEEGELLDGRSLTVPRLPHVGDDGKATFPDVPALVGRWFAERPADVVRQGLNPKLVSLWLKTAAVYDDVLYVTPRHKDTGAGLWTIRVGDESPAVGILAPMRLDEDMLDRAHGVERGWRDLLGRVEGFAAPEGGEDA